MSSAAARGLLQSGDGPATEDLATELSSAVRDRLARD